MNVEVWVVWYDNGQNYDGHYESVVGVFSSKDKAQEYIGRMENTPNAIPRPGYLASERYMLDKPLESL